MTGGLSSAVSSDDWGMSESYTRKGLTVTLRSAIDRHLLVVSAWLNVYDGSTRAQNKRSWSTVLSAQPTVPPSNMIPKKIGRPKCIRSNTFSIFKWLSARTKDFWNLLIRDNFITITHKHQDVGIKKATCGYRLIILLLLYYRIVQHQFSISPKIP